MWVHKYKKHSHIQTFTGTSIPKSSTTHLLQTFLATSTSLSLHLPLPPLRCKRPWCLFECLPRHISMANLACYACAGVAKSLSFIVMTHKARPKTQMSLCHQTPLDKRKHAFILEEEKERINTDWPPLPPNSKSILMIKPWVGVWNSGFVAWKRGQTVLQIVGN